MPFSVPPFSRYTLFAAKASPFRQTCQKSAGRRRSRRIRRDRQDEMASLGQLVYADEAKPLSTAFSRHFLFFRQTFASWGESLPER